MNRERQFNIRLSAAEATRLQIVADHYGLSAAAVVRMILKREADAVTEQQARVRRGRAREDGP